MALSSCKVTRAGIKRLRIKTKAMRLRIENAASEEANAAKESRPFEDIGFKLSAMGLISTGQHQIGNAGPLTRT